MTIDWLGLYTIGLAVTLVAVLIAWWRWPHEKPFWGLTIALVLLWPILWLVTLTAAFVILGQVMARQKGKRHAAH